MILLTGCASNEALYFGTYSRIGIDASTDGIGIGAKNHAFNLAPSKTDGSAFSVLGHSDMDLSYTKAVITEEFATGKAATCAAYKKTNKEFTKNILEAEDAEKSLNNNANTDKPKIGTVIFGTYSSLSIFDLSWYNSVSNGINFGYKRGTGVKLPIVNDQVGDVYSLVTINTTETDGTGGTIAPKSETGGTRSTYIFATGKAAIIKASQRANNLNNLSDQKDREEYAGCFDFNVTTAEDEAK